MNTNKRDKNNKMNKAIENMGYTNSIDSTSIEEGKSDIRKLNKKK